MRASTTGFPGSTARALLLRNFSIAFSYDFSYFFLVHFRSPPYYLVVSLPITSFIIGPSSPFTISPNSSALIKVKQHTFPSFSQLTRANLSPVWISALSLISLGSTICPRSSTLISASTLQQLIVPQVGPEQEAFSDFLPMSLTSSAFFAVLIYSYK